MSRVCHHENVPALREVGGVGRRDLAGAAQNEGGCSVRMDGQAVAVSTRHPSQLLAALPAWANAEAVEITEIHSAHESLAALFISLMKMHRGEV